MAAQVSSQEKFFLLVPFFGGLTLKALLLLLGSPDAVLRLIPLKCPLYFWFKITCPTCGFGRSIVFLLDGDYATSWAYHPLGIVSVHLWLIYSAWLMIQGKLSLRKVLRDYI